MTSNIESEDLENIPLVRMEDVQPARDRNCEVYSAEIVEEEVLETCIVDNVDYENECVVDNDEDSNIGSMVSIHSEEVIECDDSDSAELIVPEFIEPREIPIEIEVKPKSESKTAPDSWPTLEILPGGVIKHTEKCEDSLISHGKVSNERKEMMYACAKCSQSFKYLFCLVKHVRWHEDEQKKQRGADLAKLKTKEDKHVCLNSVKRKVISKTNKRKIPKKNKS
ncbi:uncharacterized protein ACR2FA_000314 [Aphomia sociella]